MAANRSSLPSVIQDPPPAARPFSKELSADRHVLPHADRVYGQQISPGVIAARCGVHRGNGPSAPPS